MTPPPAVRRRYLAASPFNNQPAAPEIQTFVLQDRVSHDQFGLGRVIGVEEDIAVLVDFGSHQQRLTTPYKKLFKL
jgi:hypothetical protein